MVDPVFVIMPAYNAAKTIPGVFDRIPDAARQRIQRYVVVNDGSKDDTSSVVRELQRDWDNLVLIEHEQNKGYGGAEKTLLNHCLSEGANLAILLHSDGQYSPEKIPDILDIYDRDETDILQGSRMAGESNAFGSMPFYKWIANKGLTAIENWAFGLGLAEYHSGFRDTSRRTPMVGIERE